MPPLKQHPHVVRLTAAVLIATVLQACTSWHATSLPLEPASLSPSVHPGNARITLADGSRFTVLRPEIRGDSLFGEGVGRWTRWRFNRPPGDLRPVALALTSIRDVAVEETDGTKTLLLVVGLGAWVAATIALVSSCGSYCRP